MGNIYIHHRSSPRFNSHDVRKGKESAERFEIKKKIERERRDRMGLSKKIFFVFVFFFF